uniref:Uncharacterized protein n=1 Tax=Rheinheimera sp. BAL341 TaxID=1708203 RepID=A0A486XQD9_9GAMM
MKNINLKLFMLLALLLSYSSQATIDTSGTTEQVGPAVSGLSSTKSTAITRQGYQSHVWFHRIELALSGDINGNGHYHRLAIEFDADTSMPYQQVFAEFSLWPGYGAERIYYTSSIFELYGESATDWLAIDTVLEDQFVVADYLLTVRLFDAASGYLVAEISGYDDVNLDYLPLEDYGRDRYTGSSSTVEVSAGSTGIFWLCALCCLVLLRWRRIATGV